MSDLTAAATCMRGASKRASETNNSQTMASLSQNINKTPTSTAAARLQLSQALSPAAPKRCELVSCDETSGWKVRASDGALNTSNPIREIIETMNLAENPDKKVIPLSIGDPTIFGNLKPCKEILDAIQKANASGKYYGYQVAAGMEVARGAVADYHHKCTGNRVRPQDVILASGCSHAIDLCICVLAKAGQNILIPRPGFPLYKTLTSVYGVRYKQYNLIADKNWSIDLKHLESLIDAQTAAIVINNPSNPCGSVFSERHLRQILRLAERHRLPIISDEIYDKFVFSPDIYEGVKATPQTTTATSNGPTNRTSTEAEQRWQQTNNNANNQQQCKSNGARSNANVENERPTVAVNGNSGGDSMKAAIKSSGEQFHSLAKERLLHKLSNLDSEISKLTNDADDEDDDDDATLGDTNDNHFCYVPFKSLASLSEKVPILTCGGISKTCLIPGLRLGWIIINDRQNIFDQSVRNGLGRLTQRLMGPNSLVQGALQDILTNVPDHFYEKTMDFIFQNAKLCYERLLVVKGLQPYMPQGSMYLMVRFNPKMFPTINGDLDFTSKLMNEESVLVLPGKCFDFPNFFRVCLTVPTNVMQEALSRIGDFCERHAIELEEPTPTTTTCVATVSATVDYQADLVELDKQKNCLTPIHIQANGKSQSIGTHQ